MQGADAVHLVRLWILMCVFIQGVNYGFAYLFRRTHTETGQLDTVEQLCQKMFYLTFYKDC